MSLQTYLNPGLNRTITRFRLSVYIWLILLVLALLALAPINSLLRNSLGHFYLPDKPVMPFELNLAEVFLANQEILSPYVGFLLTLMLLTGLIFTFLSAGLFGRMLSPDPVVTLREFLSDGARHFWKFFLSLLVFLPFLAVLLILFRLLTAPLNLWSSRAVTEWPVIISANLRMLVLILLWTAFKLFLDLTRIIMISESKKVIPAYVSALRFLKRHFFRFWGLYLLLGLAVIIISAFWFFIMRLIPSGAGPGVLAFIFLGQIYIIFRVLARQVFIGVEYAYYLRQKGE
ncbi:MAG: hypothetical protein QHH43_00130 [Candidatus Saccharicenans sp.]|nr:hypothetical protein [Candidatus Saccharicenans sp.]MDH7574150.1 hypothetical protein [Candidatus Saccharicenans sp.]